MECAPSSKDSVDTDNVSIILKHNCKLLQFLHNFLSKHFSFLWKHMNKSSSVVVVKRNWFSIHKNNTDHNCQVLLFSSNPNTSYFGYKRRNKPGRIMDSETVVVEAVSEVGAFSASFLFIYHFTATRNAQKCISEYVTFTVLVVLIPVLIYWFLSFPFVPKEWKTEHRNKPQAKRKTHPREKPQAKWTQTHKIDCNTKLQGVQSGINLPKCNWSTKHENIWMQNRLSKLSSNCTSWDSHNKVKNFSFGIPVSCHCFLYNFLQLWWHNLAFC